MKKTMLLILTLTSALLFGQNDSTNLTLSFANLLNDAVSGKISVAEFRNMVAQQGDVAQGELEGIVRTV